MIQTRSAVVAHLGGELPWHVIIDGTCWGIFRQEREAVRYAGQVIGCPRQEVEAAIREREVGER